MEIATIYENAINHWRDAKGIGTALIPHPLNDKLMVLGVLQRMYSRSPTCKTVIIVPSFSERANITEFITQQNIDEENNEEFKQLIKSGNIKILTEDYIEKCNFNVFPFLCIVYRPESIRYKMNLMLSNSKFKLIVLNKLLHNSEDMTTIYKIAPILSDFKQNEINELRLSTPVEETLIGIDIIKDSEDFKLLNYYNEYITTSINIFGSFDIINQANTGNNQLNISSLQICSQIAHENGWNEHLDMSIEFNVEIDKLYNPVNLKERASKTYEIIRNRSQLLSDYKLKLEEIHNIVKCNPDKKILIINKRADFATNVTEYLNTLSETNICLNYHDKVEPIPAVDIKGNPIMYKSGVNKGKRKTMGAKAQKTYAVDMFNKGNVNILSTNNAPDKDLNIVVDIIIITSPQCEELKSYLYRLSHLNFNNNKIQLYTLYCKNSQEQKLLESRIFESNHNVKNSNSSEDFSDFSVVD